MSQLPRVQIPGGTKSWQREVFGFSYMSRGNDENVMVTDRLSQS